MSAARAAVACYHPGALASRRRAAPKLPAFPTFFETRTPA